MEEGMGQTISCPAHGCDILVDDNTVMRLITDSKVKLKYQHLITNSFVEVSFYLNFLMACKVCLTRVASQRLEACLELQSRFFA